MTSLLLVRLDRLFVYWYLTFTDESKLQFIYLFVHVLIENQIEFLIFVQEILTAIIYVIFKFLEVSASI